MVFLENQLCLIIPKSVKNTSKIFKKSEILHLGIYFRAKVSLRPSVLTALGQVLWTQLVLYKKIEVPVACDILSVVRFLNAKNIKPAEIHRQIAEVYGEYAMSDPMVVRWVQLINDASSFKVSSNSRNGLQTVYHTRRTFSFSYAL